ncbi:transcriptional regulator [Candidatus Kaiserbacteria bacterium RIFCSPHIGHO2_01_FULL_56_24]|uniref:Transcriptional regulator n=1 Tax=Candidatus Kaiserbacteria bacterium RIFCSPHIGHO2_01_FULL_56_24 TaxID=1798487 RepID=A0A1F6DEG3_9BACT|nr:MAG: transcriptional regulator [Candidatus Kaiserbacteria bacterium RIFCSPHIGHO2_01_FULL_56_24]
MESVSNMVQKLRMNRGLTQEELAQKAGVSRQTVIAIEKGNYTPSVLLALKIARLFKVPVEDIFSLRS